MSEYGTTTVNGRVGVVLQRIRQELGRRNPKGNRYHALSQEEFGRLLAAKLGTDAPKQSTISQWEAGSITVPSAVLFAAIQLLGPNDPFGEELLADLKRSCLPNEAQAA